MGSDDAVKQPRPSMPGALTVLYLTAIVAAVIAIFAAFSLGGSVGFPAAAAPVGSLIGVAVGVFVPPLMTHAVVAAIYDLRWDRGGRGDVAADPSSLQ